MKKIYLASSSPRRQQILKELGLNFTVSPPVDFEEKLVGAAPEQLVCENALGKARVIASKYTNSIIIGCDTLIILNNEIFGKPLTPEKAYMTLKKLRGNYHSVVSGLAVIDTKDNKELVKYEKTEVKFKDLSESVIRDYVESGEPLDKAGAYGIQGSGGKFVEEIKGSYSSVVGLPKELLVKFLSELGIKVS
jgi:septum formation protein